METTFSMPGAALCYCIITGVGTMIAYFILPETEGRTLEEIELHFSDNSKSIFDRKIPKARPFEENMKKVDLEQSASLLHVYKSNEKTINNAMRWDNDLTIHQNVQKPFSCDNKKLEIKTQIRWFIFLVKKSALVSMVLTIYMYLKYDSRLWSKVSSKRRAMAVALRGECFGDLSNTPSLEISTQFFHCCQECCSNFTPDFTFLNDWKLWQKFTSIWRCMPFLCHFKPFYTINVTCSFSYQFWNHPRKLSWRCVTGRW